MTNDAKYFRLMDKAIRKIFYDAFGIVLKDRVMFRVALKMIYNQWKASFLRKKYKREGVQIPPYMIISITGRCNLNCKGCYIHAQERINEGEMDMGKLRECISEAVSLGVSIILLAGGEPLMRPEILDTAALNPGALFLLFTNGLLINDEIIRKLKARRNIVPVISIEGHSQQTDSRRGEGVFKKIGEILPKLSNDGIFFGVSFTVTRANMLTVTDDRFISGLKNEGCKLFFYVEYVPFRTGTESWVLLSDERKFLSERLDILRLSFPCLFAAFPGDEDKFGGCMSAGRGFIHISPGGNVEPCPFAPFSESNLKGISLKDALQSDFLKAIRDRHLDLQETNGGCALWEKREWVGSLLRKNDTGNIAE